MATANNLEQVCISTQVNTEAKQCPLLWLFRADLCCAFLAHIREPAALLRAAVIFHILVDRTGTLLAD